MFYWLLKFLFGSIVRLIWVKSVEGLENIPKTGPVILAANHSSYFDFLCMGAVVPRRMYFLAAEKFYKSSFWRPIMLLTGQVRVERKSKDKGQVFTQAETILKQGNILGIFPEGMRSRTGKINMAYNGVAKIARSSNVSIIPVAIEGTFGIMSPNDKLPHFKKICTIKFLPKIELKYILENDPEVIVQKTLMPKIANALGEKYIVEDRK